MKINEIKLFSKIILPIFSRINPWNIYITHHYTGDKLLIHSFRHKGYWYHQREREKEILCCYLKN